MHTHTGAGECDSPTRASVSGKQYQTVLKLKELLARRVGFSNTIALGVA